MDFNRTLSWYLIRVLLGFIERLFLLHCAHHVPHYTVQALRARGNRTSDRAGPGRGPSLLQLGPCDTGRAGPSFRAWPVKHGPGRAGPPAWPRPAGPGQETGQGRGLRPAFLVSEDPNFTVTVRSSPLPLYSACVVYSDEYLYSLSLL